MHNESPSRTYLWTVHTLYLDPHLALTRAWPHSFRLPLRRRRATCSPLCFLPLMLFHPYSTSRLLVFALILFPKSFGFELVPVTFQIFESAVIVSDAISV